jgi:hypothetical protein
VADAIHVTLQVLVPAIVFAVVAGSWLRQAGQNRVAILSRILDRVGGEVQAEGPLRDRVVGEHHGRPFALALGTSALPWGRGYPVRAVLELRHAPPIRLRVRRDRGLASVEKSLGLVRDVEVAGGDRFDARYLVEADDGPAQAPLADAEVREAVDRILARWDLEEVRVEGGSLEVRGDSRRLGQTMLHELLYELEVLAQAYDRRPALEIGVQARFFWTGGAEGARCPYCHDGITADDDLSACGRCGTLIHPECHSENGGCPILGCGGRGADPTRPLKVPE